MDLPIEIVESTYEESGKGILSLLNQGERSFDGTFIDWRYRKRPLGYLVIAVAREPNGQVVGCRSVFPYLFRMRGEEKVFGFQADLFVHKDFRKVGLGEKLVKFCIDRTRERGIRTILGMPNFVSAEIQKKQSFKQIGVVQGFRRYFSLRHRLGGKITNPSLLNVLSKITEGFLRFRSPENAFERENGYHLVAEKTINEDFDRLWDEISKSIDIIGNRSSEYLSWRYINHPYKPYEVLKLKKDNRLVGYMIYQKKEGGRVYVDDVLIIPDPVMADNLIGKCLLHFRKTRVNEVEIGLSEANFLIPHLLRFGFRACPDQWPFLVLSQDDTEPFLYDISRWHLTFGDKDM